MKWPGHVPVGGAAHSSEGSVATIAINTIRHGQERLACTSKGHLTPNHMPTYRSSLRAYTSGKERAKRGSLGHDGYGGVRGGVEVVGEHDADVDVVVTEFGIARLQDASVRQKAERLIAVAHPDHRSELQEAARRMQVL